MVISLQPIVQMQKIVKVYPNGIVANNEVDFSVQKGEIHALVGENGAGKTTLMKILFGIEQPTTGTISIAGQEQRIQSVAQALQLGLGMVQQHFMLVPSMTVAENIVLGAEPTKHLLLDRERALQMTRELCETYSFHIDPAVRVEDLPVGDKQKVEILKVLFRQAGVLILDEPTAVLTPQETQELFRQLEILKERGHTIVFISHKLREVQALCDRVTIMRKARTVGVYALADITLQQISQQMMGQEVVLQVDKSPAVPQEPCLAVNNIRYVTEERKQVVKNLSFVLRAGEILGIVGVEGNGQKELVDMLTGFLQPTEGTITIGGQDIAGKSVSTIRDLSMAYIPQERMETGVAQNGSLVENVVSVAYRRRENRRGPLLRWGKLGAMAQAAITDYAIQADSIQVPVRMLSGGNIQKVVVARELEYAPRLIIADQPTRGIDIGAANLIHNQLVKLRDAGSAVLLISADLSEMLTISDSILVLFDGQFSAYFPQTTGLQETELGLFMLGVQKMEDEAIRRCCHV